MQAITNIRLAILAAIKTERPLIFNLNGISVPAKVEGIFSEDPDAPKDELGYSTRLKAQFGSEKDGYFTTPVPYDFLDVPASFAYPTQQVGEVMGDFYEDKFEDFAIRYDDNQGRETRFDLEYGRLGTGRYEFDREWFRTFFAEDWEASVTNDQKVARLKEMISDAIDEYKGKIEELENIDTGELRGFGSEIEDACDEFSEKINNWCETARGLIEDLEAIELPLPSATPVLEAMIQRAVNEYFGIEDEVILPELDDATITLGEGSEDPLVIS